MKKLKKWLKKLRENKKLSQLEVAKKLDISESYYCLIENGERQKDLDLSLVLKLSKLFDVSVDYIIAEEEKLRCESEAEAIPRVMK